jgi:hypothetical protein
MRHCTVVLALLLPTAIPATAAEERPAALSAGSLKRALDRQPRADEKPFAPADGSTSSIDPPAVSRSGEFPAAATTVADNVPISVHVFTKTLGAGKWYWRVGVRGNDRAIVWGKIRSFTIAAGAQAWPLPTIDLLAAKIPPRHPRLFFPGDELARVRRECSRSLQKDYQRLLAEASKRIGEPLVAEPPKLLPRGDARGAQYADIIRSTRPTMDGMQLCALAYLLSKDQRFGQEAKRRLQHFFSWDPQGSTDLFHNDEPAMWMMQRGTRAYDWTYELFTPDERAKIEPVMKVRYRQFLQRLTAMPFESRPYSSHPARDVGFLGEGAIAFMPEWPEARQWLQYVLSIFWSVYPAWAQEDGGWQEGPSYWEAYQSLALHFATALEKATGARLIDKPFFHNTPYYKLYTNPPYARMSPFGDNQQSAPRGGSGQVMSAFAVLLHDPYLQWYPEVQKSDRDLGPLGFALADPEFPAKPPADLPQARLFAGVGLVAMHDNLADPRGNAYLLLRSSPFGSISHGHADQNAFTIEAFGEALAIASGYYPWYGSPHHQHWVWETRSVNSITLDGSRGQTTRSPESRGRIMQFVTGNRYDYALGDATAAYGGRLTKFYRHVIHIRPARFVIIDELEARQPATFQWRLHALEKMSVDAAKQQVLIHRGKARLAAEFLAPGGLKFDQTDQFDPPPERGGQNQWHLVASTPVKTTSAQFMVVLAAYRAGHGKDAVPPAMRTIAAGQATGVQWQEGPTVQQVFFAPRGGIHVGGQQAVDSDARIVAVTRHPQGTAEWLVVDATRLTLSSPGETPRTLFTADRPTTATK